MNWIILASGPSLLESLPIAYPAGTRVMCVNGSWRAHPAPDVIYSNDHDWWAHDLAEIQRERPGARRFTGYPFAAVPGVDQTYQYAKGERGLCLKPNTLAWGGNSGYAAINLAWHLGARRIVLCGYDMCGDTHWHGDHPDEIRKPFNFPMWLQRFDELARDAKRVKLEILNASRITALRCFPRMRWA